MADKGKKKRSAKQNSDITVELIKLTTAIVKLIKTLLEFLEVWS